jgi:hypothetical protein
LLILSLLLLAADWFADRKNLVREVYRFEWEGVFAYGTTAFD